MVNVLMLRASWRPPSKGAGMSSAWSSHVIRMAAVEETGARTSSRLLSPTPSGVTFGRLLVSKRDQPVSG